MPVLDAAVDAESPALVRAGGRAGEAVAALRELEAAARSGGGERAVERHRSRGKLTVHERLALLADPGAPVLELSVLAAHGLYGGDVAGGGMLTAIAQVSGRWCVVIANDATVKGGTYFPVSVRKHLRAQEIAQAGRLPCIYLVDSGGAHLPLQDEMFADRDHGGRFFYNQARMSAQRIAQVACVMGSCTAGGAYVPAMCDESVIVRGTGTIFLAGPPLVKAATGEVVTAEALGGADVHGRISGLVDHVADNDEHAIAIVRELLRHVPHRAPRLPWRRREARPPRFAAGELGALAATFVDGDGDGATFPAHDVLARLVDDSALHEFKPEYGHALVCGFAHLDGYPVAVVASAAPITRAAAQKGAHFVQLACRRRVPLLFVQGCTDVARDGSQAAALPKDLAKLAAVVAAARVPMLTVVAGDGSGAAAFALAARNADPRLLLTWPTARAGSPADAGGGTPYDAVHATARLWDDGIVEPEHTRDRLAIALAAACEAPIPRTRFGVVRM